MKERKGQKIVIRENGSIRVQSINDEKTKTQQQFRDQCDVNNIMKKYLDTGSIHHLNRKQGVYANLIGMTDYQQSLEKIMSAEKAFNDLPSNVRSRFKNDPSELLSFLNDENNRSEAIELGLIEKPAEIETPPAPQS